MRRSCIAAAVLLSAATAFSQGIPARINNTTLRLPQAAPAVTTNSYAVSNAFPTLSAFSGPVCLRVPPGETNRLFVVEQPGTITVVTNLAHPGKATFLDVSGKTVYSGEEGLLSMAFHPNYASNRYFYIWYVIFTNTLPGSNPHERLSRFQTSATNINFADPTTEVALITQYDQDNNHNGGDLHFGPDGYLYVSLGDEGGGDDSDNNSQKITNDFFSGMLRIDVDKLPGSLAPNPHAAIDGATTNYAVPPDNPYVGATNFNGATITATNKIRTEFYAVGLRNPFRYCFDRVTGELMLSDVGQNHREEVDLIVKGGNYGWAFREGALPSNNPHPTPAPYNQTSLLANAGFELGNGTTGITSWIRTSSNETREGTSGFGYSLPASSFPNGTNALKEFGSASDLYQTNLSVFAGSNYFARGLFYHSSQADVITNSALSTRMYLKIDWFDVANSLLASSTSAVHNGLVLSDSWHPIEMTVTSPPSAHHATFHIKTDSNSGSGSVWADRFYFGLQTNFESSYKEPLLDYDHSGNATNTGNVVIGGIVYRGDRFPELVGSYLFCDDGGGDIWAMTHDGLTAQTWSYLANDSAIAGFEEDPRNGDVLMANVGNGQVQRLLYAAVSTNFPQTLADTGVFSNLTTLAVSTGIVPFEINQPFWSDNAIKTRWFCVPSTNLTIDFDAESAWSFPTSMVWIKHFDLLLTNGVTSSAHRVETRILVKNGDILNGGYGVTYRWGSSLTNATLVPDGGLDEEFLIDDGGGNIHTQVWHYPARNECLFCHRTAVAGSPGFSLGFNTVQLNKDHNYSGITSNQLRALNAAGYFSTNLTGFHTFQALAQPTNVAYSLEYRARSYLQANCRQCHFPPNGIPGVPWDARIFTPLSGAGIINGALFDNLGDTNNRVIVPNSTTNSVMLYRISRRGDHQMPPIATSVVDTQGVALITAWILGSSTNFATFAQWQTNYFGSSTNPLAAGNADADGDGNVNDLEFLTGTNPTNPVGDAWSYGFAVTSGAPQISFLRVANRGFDVQFTTNLVGAAWQSLDVTGNEPFFGITDQAVTVDDVTTNLPGKFYRINVYEP